MHETGAPAARSVASIVAAALVVALAAVAIAGALALPLGGWHVPEAGFMPLVEASLLGIFAVALLVVTVRDRGAAIVEWPEGEARRRVAGTSAGLVAYAALLPVAGFGVATFLYLSFAIAWWGGYPIVRAALFGAAIALGLHLVFVTMLRMSLPTGWW